MYQAKFRDLRRTKFLNAQASEPLAKVNAFIERLAIDDTSAEPAGKGITSAVGITDLLLSDLVDGVLLDGILALNGNDGRLSALGDDGNALSLRVDLGQICERLGNLLDVGETEAVRLGVGRRLALVADNVVPVRGRSVEGLLEELRDERRREGENKRLVALRGLLAQLHDSGRAN